MYLLSNIARRGWIILILAVFYPLGMALAQTSPIPASIVDQSVYDAVTRAGHRAKTIQAFYASTNYAPIWIGQKNKNRRTALLAAIRASGDQGLPVSRYNADKLDRALSAPDTANAGVTELMATKIYLQYAHDLSSGAVNPKKIDKDLDINRPMRSDQNLLEAFVKSSPAGFLKSLAPASKEYRLLLAEKKILERSLGAAGGTADIPRRTLKRGSSGKSVVLLRQRLAALGYGDLGDAPKYDDDLKASVTKFQKANGLSADGVAGPSTIGRLNQGPKQKLIKVLVNLERERWMNFPRGKRNVLVNQASYTVYMFDNGRVSYQTRAIIGTQARDRRTPEFYDEITHMVVNPTWHVPSSIAGKEYLPMLRKNPNALKRQNMVMVSATGQKVNPANLDLSQYTKDNFPFSLSQRPSAGNALGRVKFMFPNKFNVYLHDTPTKRLFGHDRRAFSHGCVRIQNPYGFAYKLLEKQTSDPEGAFAAWLKTGKEQYVNLAKPVPIYLTYRTAYFGVASKPSYYPDIYGRDKEVFKALSKAGVSLRAVQS